MTDERKNNTSAENEAVTPKPDAETLHTTDPQENMQGPLSSLMHNTGESFDTEETKKEADEEKDRGM